MTEGSQNLQDKLVLQYLNQRREGFFVDIGAWDGSEFSNTIRLEQNMGWTGLLAECDITALDRLIAKRPACKIESDVIWSISGVEVDFKQVAGGKLSGAVANLSYDKAIRAAGNIIGLRTISLGDALDKHNCPRHIDYLSMDIEGSEFEVLSGYDFSRTFDVMTIEHRNDKEKIIDLLDSKGYIPHPDRCYEISDMETFFIRKPV